MFGKYNFVYLQENSTVHLSPIARVLDVLLHILQVKLLTVYHKDKMPFGKYCVEDITATEEL